MKGLRYFNVFDSKRFFDGKVLSVSSVSVWQDYETKQIVGTKVEAVIIEDKTNYPTKNGVKISNRYQTLTFKVSKPLNDIQSRITLDMIITPVNPVCTIYGNYGENLSIKCDDVQVVKSTS